jgi:hypothetical protein
MTLTDSIQVLGLLAECVFIPLFVWLGKCLLKIHVDVQALMIGFRELKEQMAAVALQEHRLTRVEMRLDNLTEKLNQ